MVAPHAFRHLLGAMMIETAEGDGGGGGSGGGSVAPAPAPAPASVANSGGWRGNAAYGSAPVFFEMNGSIIPDAYMVSADTFESPSRGQRYRVVSWMLSSGDADYPNLQAFPWVLTAADQYGGGNIVIGAREELVNYSDVQYGPSSPWVSAPAPAPAPAPAAVPAPVPVVNPDTGQVQYPSAPAPAPGSGLPVLTVTPTPAAPSAPVTAGGGAATGEPAIPGAWGGTSAPAPAAPGNARGLILAALAALAFLN